MVFFIDEDLDSNNSTIISTGLREICGAVVSRFGENQRKVEEQLNNDIQQDQVILNLIFCPPSNFPSYKESESGVDHVLLEQWKIESTREEEPEPFARFDWNEANGRFLQKSPLATEAHYVSKLMYGRSSEIFIHAEESKTEFVTFYHASWLQDYNVSITYGKLPDNFSQGKLFVELDSSSVPFYCGHSEKNCFSPISAKKKSTVARPLSSQPIPIPTASRSSLSLPMPGSPCASLFKKRARAKSSIGSRHRCSVSPGSEHLLGFAGSLQESLLSGRMSTTKSTLVEGFTSRVSASSPSASPSQLKIPFDTVYYHLDDQNKTPYAASIFLPKERFRIAPSGSLQVCIANPTGTPIKLFVVPYDFTNMKANTKTFIRQITQTEESPKVLQYAVQFTIICTKSQRLYLYKSIKVVFPHRKPDDHINLETFSQSPDTPQFFHL